MSAALASLPVAAARHWPLAFLPLIDPATPGDLFLDLSAQPRFGLRGPGTGDWLTARGLALPEVNRTTTTQGLRIARLGSDEVLVLPATSDATPLANLRRDWAQAECAKGFDAWRDEGWAWLRVTGLEAVLPLLTAADTRDAAFPADGVLQTRALHMDVVMLRDGASVDLFFDVASSHYAADFLAAVLPGHRQGRVSAGREE
ncbi:hypothetical protein [Pararhodobacter sp. CCB-MM2]|uniref:hypothetical protein n=1 Tax=Pararhodobacter sp. CCB-MM2 TaxID=1786003 RepID=UPI00083063E3|nr:hypothetical protein [Pararhodobacter sp. CCB-MM2]